MAMTGIYNFPAQLAHRNLRKSNVKLSLTIAQLSAGRRVLSAKDDAAALAIGSRLGAEVAGLHQAYANVGQAASVLQVADGGMTRIDDMLGRMKALAVQASSGQLSATDRDAINTEFKSLSAEIDRVAKDTDFAGTKLLDGSTGSMTFKVGTGVDPAADNLTVSFDGATASALAVDTADVSTQAGANAAIGAVDNAIDSLQGFRANLGASRNRLDFAAANVATTIENTEAARSGLIDLDVAAASADLANSKLLNTAGIFVLNQANNQAKNLLRLLI